MVIFDGKKCGKLWKSSLIVYSLIQLQILLFKLKKKKSPVLNWFLFLYLEGSSSVCHIVHLPNQSKSQFFCSFFHWLVGVSILLLIRGFFLVSCLHSFYYSGDITVDVSVPVLGLCMPGQPPVLPIVLSYVELQVTSEL